MPKITLSNNQEAFVGVSHGPIDVHVGLGSRRGTKVWLETPDQKVSVASVCRPPDNFCRSTGRLIAARKLNAKLKDLQFSREDRRKVFQTIYS